MSDAAFKSAPFSAYSTPELETRITALRGDGFSVDVVVKMRAEINRRAKVEAGDVSVMTPGERLRFAAKGR